MQINTLYSIGDHVEFLAFDIIQKQGIIEAVHAHINSNNDNLISYTITKNTPSIPNKWLIDENDIICSTTGMKFDTKIATEPVIKLSS